MRLTLIRMSFVFILVAGCAGARPHANTDLLEADWIVGTWRIDSYIQAATQRRDIRLHLTFLPDGSVEVIDQTGSSRMATRCRWYPRVKWIDTSCRGVDVRILPNPTGPLEVELSGAIRVPYYTEQCARWGVDANGNRICLRWEEVERFRSVAARGRGVLEPYS